MLYVVFFSQFFIDSAIHHCDGVIKVDFINTVVQVQNNVVTH